MSETVIPEAVTPEAVTPEAVTPEAVTPEAVTPEAVTPEEGSNARGLRKTRVGQVVSAKMNKTIVVEVIRRVPHAKFKKIIKRTTKFYAHDEKSEAREGQRVRIMETRPMSKLKRWRLVEVLAN